MSRRVIIQTREVGQAFGCMGIVRDAKSRHRLAETRVFPYGFNANAYSAAEDKAKAKGWTIVEVGS